jgi:DNA-binding MarR family transcriptional regulator
MEKIRNEREELVFQSKLILEASKFLSWNSIKVFLYLSSIGSMENNVSVEQKKIQKDLNYDSVTSVKMAISELKKYGIITSVQDNQDGRKNIYFLNSYQDWKGELGENIKRNLLNINQA